MQNKSPFLRILLCVSLVIVAGTTHGQTGGEVTGKQIRVAPNINPAVSAEPLSDLINTPYRELGPMPTKDGKRLYFSRAGFPGNIAGVDDEDIWYSEFDDITQQWTRAINAGAPLNNAGPNFITGVGRNGDTLLLGNVYGKKGKMSAGVSISVRTGETWSDPFPVKIAGDYNISAKAGYDLSADRTVLIIAQEKADSQGKLDLYASFRDPTAKYPYSGTESINLGSVINTSGDETSPWLAYDGMTLYFASDGHKGHGELDLFMSKRLDKTWTKWSEPVNLGPGINSHYDDMSFNYNPTSRYAFFSRGVRPSNTDIYQIDMTHFFKDVGDQHPQRNIYRGEIGQTRVVYGVFENDASAISKDAMAELQQVQKYLTDNKTMVVQICAHSNVHGVRTESEKLSNQRASNVFDYLVKNGIDKKRMSFMGFGHDIVTTSKETSNSLSPGSNIASSVEFKLIKFEN